MHLIRPQKDINFIHEITKIFYINCLLISEWIYYNFFSFNFSGVHSSQTWNRWNTNWVFKIEDIRWIQLKIAYTIFFVGVVVLCVLESKKEDRQINTDRQQKKKNENKSKDMHISQLVSRITNWDNNTATRTQ